MFVKINSEANINISETYRIWESSYIKNTIAFDDWVVEGYSIEDFKTLYNYYKQNNIYFMDLTIPREDHIRVCDQCDGIFRHKGLYQDRVCDQCDGTGKFRLLL